MTGKDIVDISKIIIRQHVFGAGGISRSTLVSFLRNNSYVLHNDPEQLKSLYDFCVSFGRQNDLSYTNKLISSVLKDVLVEAGFKDALEVFRPLKNGTLMQSIESRNVDKRIPEEILSQDVSNSYKQWQRKNNTLMVARDDLNWDNKALKLLRKNSGVAEKLEGDIESKTSAIKQLESDIDFFKHPLFALRHALNSMFSKIFPQKISPAAQKMLEVVNQSGIRVSDDQQIKKEVEAFYHEPTQGDHEIDETLFDDNFGPFKEPVVQELPRKQELAAANAEANKLAEKTQSTTRQILLASADADEGAANILSKRTTAANDASANLVASTSKLPLSSVPPVPKPSRKGKEPLQSANKLVEDESASRNNSISVDGPNL